MTTSQTPKVSSDAASPAAPVRARRGGPTDPSHDEDLRRGILRTDVSRPVATFLAAAFLALIYAVPIGQAIRDKVVGDDSVLLDLFRHAPTKENIKEFEDELDKASTPREFIRPRMQMLFTRYGGFGNGKAVIGQDDWLFYGPGVTAVGGPGFLNEGLRASREKAALDEGSAALFADPRPAILEFARYLATRGIQLVLLPIPDKASLQPVELHGRRPSGDIVPPRNPDIGQLEDEVRAAGVMVFDPTPPILVKGEPPRFLRQDTHWTPTWMESVASDLARVLEKSDSNVSPRSAPRQWHVTAKPVTRVGDVTDMLGLGEGQTLLAPETTTIHEVRDEKGVLFEGKEDADVLLMGDSFTNVFSLDQMGWGEGGGFGAHLARALGRDVDILAQNDSGAFATRQLLSNALADKSDNAGTRDRLSGKTFVVWEFASRELAVGNWKPISWPKTQSATGQAKPQIPAAPRGATP